jgi:hypothetical protein
MKKHTSTVLGLTIISIGLIASFINLLNLYYYPIGIRFQDIFRYNVDIIEPLLKDIFPPEQEQQEQLEVEDPSEIDIIPPQRVYEGRATQVGPGAARDERQRHQVSKKVSPKSEGVSKAKKRPKPVPVVEEKSEEKDVSTSAPVALAKPALVSEPVVTASLTTKLIAYFDIEKILSWAANIITIVTGVLIILRRRKED